MVRVEAVPRGARGRFMRRSPGWLNWCELRLVQPAFRKETGPVNRGRFRRRTSCRRNSKERTQSSGCIESQRHHARKIARGIKLVYIAAPRHIERLRTLAIPEIERRRL